ncbi:hypothetical protein [Phenylobacterium sp.]|jgi:hypothetical protein|uniref:hypothetical protein n=1 Tax=Phenylobacterium sp. TaxID=1871053 RepID=UPI002F9262F3
MSDDQVERTIITDETGAVRQEVVRVRENSTGWWVAALIGLIAIIGVFFVVTANTGTTEAELQAAREQGMAEAALANATADAQMAAVQASQAAQSTMDSTARASEIAAANAQAAAQQAAQQAAQTAQSAAEAAQNAATSEPLPE